jgi:hypothetical protein
MKGCSLRNSSASKSVFPSGRRQTLSPSSAAPLASEGLRDLLAHLLELLEHVPRRAHRLRRSPRSRLRGAGGFLRLPGREVG